MSLTRRLKIPGFAVVVAAIAVGLTGCAGASLAQAKPTVGECWKTTYASAVKYADWEGKAAVGCATPHQAYTYAVPQLSGTFPQKWSAVTTAIELQIDTAAVATCAGKATALGVTATEARLVPLYFLPSIESWDSGQRWIRCDFGLLKLGTEPAHHRLAVLASEFAGDLAKVRSAPAMFHECQNDEFNNGPDGAGAVLADCAGTPDWYLVAVLDLPDAPGAGYPGTASVQASAGILCATVKTPKGHEVKAFAPDETDWVSRNDRAVDCWLDNN